MSVSDCGCGGKCYICSAAMYHGQKMMGYHYTEIMLATEKEKIIAPPKKVGPKKTNGRKRHK